MLKALIVQQPWAWAIAHAGKTIENRTWYTYQRGTAAIHAGMTCRDDKMPRGVANPADDDIVLGTIVAIVDLVDVVESSRSKWFHGPFGFVFENIRPLRQPVMCPGALRFWVVPPAKVGAITRQLSAPDRVFHPLIRPK